MIRRDGGQQQLVCDGCGEETPDFDEFEDMISAAKADGWSITKPSDTWEHRCPCCGTGASRLAAAKRKFGL